MVYNNNNPFVDLFKVCKELGLEDQDAELGAIPSPGTNLEKEMVDALLRLVRIKISGQQEKLIVDVATNPKCGEAWLKFVDNVRKLEITSLSNTGTGKTLKMIKDIVFQGNSIKKACEKYEVGITDYADFMSEFHDNVRGISSDSSALYFPKSNSSPIIKAINTQNEKMVKVLFELGVDLSAPDSDNRTPLQQVIKKNLVRIADAIHRYGIILTGMLPFSSRGILINLALSTMLIPIRLVQSAGPGFLKVFKKYLVHDWSRGIKDLYIDLETCQNQDLRSRIIKGNSRFVDYMSMGFSGQNQIGTGSIVSAREIEANTFTFEHSLTLKRISDKLTKEMGFLVDGKGMYCHPKTGSVFYLVFDKEKNEIVVCFMGLGAHECVDVEEATQREVALEAVKAAGTDWFGGIPPSARQAIEIGKMLKEATKDTSIIPILVGHSHGGGLAQTGAVANGIKAVVFNSRPMGAGTRRYIGQFTVAKNSKNITTFSGKGDWLSGNKAINMLAIAFERLIGIPVPRSVGTGYYLPDMPEHSASYNHIYFSQAFAKLEGTK